jgi:hypothetical protein
MESIDLFDTRKKGKLARSQTGTVGTAAVEPASFDLVGRMTDPALGLQNPRPSVERSKTMLFVYSDLFLAVHRLLHYKFTCPRPPWLPTLLLLLLSSSSSHRFIVVSRLLRASFS